MTTVKRIAACILMGLAALFLMAPTTKAAPMAELDVPVTELDALVATEASAPNTAMLATEVKAPVRMTTAEVSAPAGPGRAPEWYMHYLMLHETDLRGRVRTMKIAHSTPTSEAEMTPDAEVAPEDVAPVTTPSTVLDDGTIFYYDLDWVKENLYHWYTAQEVRQTTLIVQAEDLIASSDTIWSAHVWCILDRVGAPGFSGNSSIIGVLSAPGQFTTYCPYNLAQTPNERIEWVVRDVFARAIMERYGAPEEMVGRTLLPEYHYFRAGGGIYNRFWTSWNGGAEYDPFSAPYNPYTN